MELKGKKINFLGDSITEGAGTTYPAWCYVEVMKRLYGLAEARNYGIGGTRIAHQQSPSAKARFDLCFCGRAYDMDTSADMVVVFGGTNDYGHGDAAMGVMTDRTDDTFYGALHNLIIALLQKYPNAQLVFMTPLHRDKENEYYNYFGVRCAGSLEDYVNVIQEVAAYYGIPVLDLYRGSGLQPAVPELKERYMPDGLHPCDAGHERIYSLLKGFLEKL